MAKHTGTMDPDVEKWWRRELKLRAEGKGCYTDDVHHITYQAVQELFNEIDEKRAALQEIIKVSENGSQGDAIQAMLEIAERAQEGS